MSNPATSPHQKQFRDPTEIQQKHPLPVKPEGNKARPGNYAELRQAAFTLVPQRLSRDNVKNEFNKINQFSFQHTVQETQDYPEAGKEGGTAEEFTSKDKTKEI